MGKPAREANGVLKGTFLAPWSAASRADWVYVSDYQFNAMAVLSDGVTMLAAGYVGVIRRSDDRGHSWYYDEGISNDNFHNELRDLVVVPDVERDLLLVTGSNLYDPSGGVKPARSSYMSGQCPVWVIDYTPRNARGSGAPT